jgi:O-antigen ligase
VNSDSQPDNKALFWLIVSLLAFAPLFRAGNLPLPLLILELGSLAVMVLLFLRPDVLVSIKTAYLALAAAIFLLPVIALTNFPVDVLQHMPGRGFLPQVYQAIELPIGKAWNSLSLVSHNTEAALWALLPPLAVFLGASSLKRRQVMKLVYLMLGVAILQAALSLMQYGGGLGSVLYISNEYGIKAAAGTYLNRDHLAGFLEMSFPVALALLAATIGQHRVDGISGSRWRKKVNFLATLKGHQATIFALIAGLVLLALIITRSRAGIALTMIGLVVALIVFARRIGGNNVYGTYGTLLAVILVLTAEIGLAPILDRFSSDPMSDLRWDIYGSSLVGVFDNFPLGSGPGTYPDAYPAYQPHDMDAFINHAHNDYLEWVFDGGIMALLLILLALLMYGLGWSRVLLKGRWRTFRYVQAGAGIGLLLLILHSFVDFNLHKPANAMYFAFLLAVFLRENTEEIEIREKSRKRVRTKRMTKPELPVPVVRKPRNGVSMGDW